MHHRTVRQLPGDLDPAAHHLGVNAILNRWTKDCPQWDAGGVMMGRLSRASSREDIPHAAA
jgi:hypothetical protein